VDTGANFGMGVGGCGGEATVAEDFEVDDVVTHVTCLRKRQIAAGKERGEAAEFVFDPQVTFANAEFSAPRFKRR
jgi:hypothetical protein